MILEQPARLNQFLADPTPVTWSRRWKYLQIFIPIVLFITICTMERVALGLWIMGRFEWSVLGPILLLPPCMLVIILLARECRLWFPPKVKTTLNVLENGLRFGPGRRPLIKWAKVAAFWFEDIPNEPALSKLTVLYFGDRNSKIPRRSSLVLDQGSQVYSLISELKLLQQKLNLNFKIETNAPLPPPRQYPHAIARMYLAMAGFLLLVNGMPLLLVGLGLHANDSNQSTVTDPMTPKHSEKMTAFIHAHFASKAEYKHFLLEAGSILTAAGFGLMFCGRWIQREKSQSSSTTLETAQSG